MKPVFAGFTNEATFASNISSEMGILTNETLQTFQNFQISGMVFNKEKYLQVGGLKSNLKLTFGARVIDIDLAKKLGDDIDFRIHRYTKCICKSTFNFVEWLKDDYRKKLNTYLRSNFDEIYEQVYGHTPED